jgi:hypothetical protein
MPEDEEMTQELFAKFYLKETEDLSYKEKIAFYNNPDYCFLVKEKDKEIMERALYNLA